VDDELDLGHSHSSAFPIPAQLRTGSTRPMTNA
jgi:hypothetical protein